jgi:dihydroorotate dehydrogenase
MGLYSILVRPFVHNADIEKASKFALRYFELNEKIPGGRLISRWIHNNRPTGLQREVFGLDFYNPIGLSAGLDLHGELYNDLNNLGFSFVEIGPMNADGIRRAIRRIQQDPQNDILAACIREDFLTAFTLAYDFCDFFVIDLSANPSTDILDPLLDARLAEDVYKPIVVKLPKELPPSETEDILDYCQMNRIDGIEVQTLEQIRHIVTYTSGRLPIIADIVIETPEQAAEALEAGASLVEVRDGLVRQGPRFISKIQKYLLNQVKNERSNPREDSPAPEA